VKLPSLKSVTPGEKPMTLKVTLTTGKCFTVDLAPMIADSRVLGPLADPALFGTVRVAYFGHGVAWGEVLDEEDQGGPIDLGADQLWRWAGEQRGEIMPTEAFRAWRARNRLTVTKAAEVLGLSRRMATYYDSGAWPVPKTVMLACEGYEARRQREAA
jgi:Protein of unknown function (DUF2442)